MRILNFGSLNIDNVYAVDHFIRPGETMSSLGMEVFCGGKGLNQSIGAQAHRYGTRERWEEMTAKSCLNCWQNRESIQIL